jgi:hypothetical protein
MALRRPSLMTRFMIPGVSNGLSTERRKAEVDWITSGRVRLVSLQEQFMSIAPREPRSQGWNNDRETQRSLEPLRFAAVAAPTLIAHGTNDAVVRAEHPS